MNTESPNAERDEKPRRRLWVIPTAQPFPPAMFLPPPDVPRQLTWRIAVRNARNSLRLVPLATAIVILVLAGLEVKSLLQPAPPNGVTLYNTWEESMVGAAGVGAPPLFTGHDRIVEAEDMLTANQQAAYWVAGIGAVPGALSGADQTLAGDLQQINNFTQLMLTIVATQENPPKLADIRFVRNALRREVITALPITIRSESQVGAILQRACAAARNVAWQYAMRFLYPGSIPSDPAPRETADSLVPCS